MALSLLVIGGPLCLDGVVGDPAHRLVPRLGRMLDEMHAHACFEIGRMATGRRSRRAR